MSEKRAVACFVFAIFLVFIGTRIFYPRTEPGEFPPINQWRPGDPLPPRTANETSPALPEPSESANYSRLLIEGE